MSRSPSQQSQSRTITLKQVRDLGISKDFAANPKRHQPVWKDFGAYLDQKLDWHFNKSIESENFEDSDAYLSHITGTSQLSQVLNFRICSICERPIAEKSLLTHYPRCIEMKEKKQASDPRSVSGGIKRKRGRAPSVLDAGNSSVDSSRGATPAPHTPSSSAPTTKVKKKYKKSQMQKEKEAANAAAAAEAASARANNAANVKRKKQAKTKGTSKVKGPVDVEKQCGVPLPLGGYCARSLTCKTHSMGAKRAVPGRSAPYDILLQQYQKRNQAKLAASNALAAQRREDAQLSGMSAGEDYGAGKLNAVLGPDEETHLVLEGLSKNYPIPLERKVIVPVRSRHRFLYMREAYANALITNGTASAALAQSNDLTLANQAISGSIGGLQGRCALVNVDNKASNNETQSYATIPGELYQVRAPLKAVLVTAQYNHQQQVLFQQQIMKLQQQQQQLLAKQRQKLEPDVKKPDSNSGLQQTQTNN